MHSFRDSEEDGSLARTQQNTSSEARTGAAAASAVAPEQRAESRPQRILLVEDNLDVAAMLAALLRLDGHELLIVHNGMAALPAAREFAPEAVLLDIGLPLMDGYEVARRLRVDPVTRDALLVAVTGYGQERDRQLARDAGFDHHLVKPVDPERLQEVLRTPRMERTHR